MYDSGNLLVQLFLDCELFYHDVSSLACVHTPNVLASFLPFFHVQVSLDSHSGSDKDYTV